MDVYENIVIGNFIFGLGVAMGLRHKNSPILPTALSLIQQTPFDKSLADVLLQNPGIVRLIEFKRAASVAAKEKSKLKVLSRALGAACVQDLASVSREIHWYVESNWDVDPDAPQPEDAYRIVPYLDFLDENIKAKFTALEKFAEAIADETCQSSLSEENKARCNRYLNLLCTYLGSAATNSGALLLQVTAEGNLRYAVVEDLTHMFTRKRHHEWDWPKIGHEREKPGRGHEREKPGRGHEREGPEREHEPERPGRGHEREGPEREHQPERPGRGHKREGPKRGYER